MKSINVVDVNNVEKADLRYPITLLCVNEQGEHLVVQAVSPVALKNYLKDKPVKDVYAMYVFGRRVAFKDMRHLERILELNFSGEKV